MACNGPIDVYILTYCRRIELFYGTGLIFKTLRHGFPNARVSIIDNCSIPEAQTEIKKLARDAECFFEAVPGQAIEHHQFLYETIEQTARLRSGRPLVFLDPDICLWEDCEDFEFDGLMAGKLVTAYNDDYLQAVLMPRLHTSFLWIPDAAKLAEGIASIKRTHFDFRPFLCFTAKMGDAWVRYDTGASLYAAARDQLSLFGREHLNCYDHLFCGCHLDLTRNTYPRKVLEVMERIHEDARAGNLAALRGIYRLQSEVWREAYCLLEAEESPASGTRA